ncbi:MAG TPA: hypothetical protein VGC13_13845 [Longimicrobium sp.]|jgi:hypothetical protein|uniref:hypothetical protein n=1 Tax=Longimicrobium sp. TaxID=2029185 RepID=UPI002ED77D9A
MDNIGWRFLQVRPEAVSQDPTQQEFFGPEEGSAGALVRESIQNSLDARSKDHAGPVRVRFRFDHSESALFAASDYFAGIIPHLLAQFPNHVPAGDTPISYLTVEDFGTRGLQGDPAHTIYDEHSAEKEVRNDYFYFWRNVGRSRKEEAERGRWGLGKTVFPASSTISSFFGLTVRANDQRRLLMGQSVGIIHQLSSPDSNRRIYEPYGYFGRFQDTNELALPIEDPGFLAAFSKAFSLSRMNEPGLSVVIPFPQKEVHPEAIVREAIRSYYLPILTGELVVQASNATNSFQITAENIREVIRTLDWRPMRMTASEMIAYVDFAADAVNVAAGGFFLLPEQDLKSAPDSLKKRLPEADLPALQEQFDTGELLAFRIPVLVKKARQTESSHLDVFLKRDDSLGSGTADCIREGLAITQTGKQPRQPVRGLALVTDKPLSTLLGDSENPAHTKWQELSDKIKEPKYIHGRSTVRLVNGAVQQLADALSFRPETRDEKLLSDIFFLPEDTSDPAKKGTKSQKDRSGESEPPSVIPEPTTSGIALSQVVGGFRISAVEVSGRTVEWITIDMAYAVASGNPLTRYRPFDFDLATMPMRGKGITIDEVSGNRVRLRVVDPQFVFALTGFDERRDLIVRAIPSYASEAE